MNYELRAALQPVCVFRDDGFSIGKKNFQYADITSVSLFSKPSALKNGLIRIGVKEEIVNATFPNKQKEEGMAVYRMLEEKLAANLHDDDKSDLTSAAGLYDYCLKHGYGKGNSKSWSIKHFQVLLDQLMPSEQIIFPFLGLHHYQSMAQNDNTFAYAITDKRLILGQKKAVGQSFMAIDLNNINDISYASGLAMGVLTIDTYKETFSVGLDKESADHINKRLHEEIAKRKASAIKTPDASPYDELRKLKELLDEGIITSEDFERKKKELLHL